MRLIKIFLDKKSLKCSGENKYENNDGAKNKRH